MRFRRNSIRTQKTNRREEGADIGLTNHQNSVDAISLSKPASTVPITIKALLYTCTNLAALLD